MNNAPLVLLILDGWGIAPKGPGNAITEAKLTTIPKLWNMYPHTTLAASGNAVGLPKEEPGNTETGHINIGAGRVVFQDLLRIDATIEDQSFYKNDVFIGAVRHAKKHSSNIHVMGIYSDVGVHASIRHLTAIMEIFQRQQVGTVYLHLFTDGRDAPPKSAEQFFSNAECVTNTYPFSKIATVIGRYYAMDRDRRWERTQSAYEALTEGSQYTASSAVAAVQYAYKRGETDEFIKPTVILDSSGSPLPRISDNDAIIFYNYRIDRPRQLTRAFVLPDFEQHSADFSFDPYSIKYYKKHIIATDAASKPFIRTKILKNLFFVTMTEYERDIPCIVAFPPQMIQDSLGEIMANHSVRQLRICESEKERFVTYYFNCMREERFAGEDRLVVPSPKVATYDLLPQMSAGDVTDRLLDRLSLGVYGFCVLNFANPDMVGHTGNIPAAIKACEFVDMCVGKIVTSVLAKNGTCFITADHGNVEEMLDSVGGIDTEHSKFNVPFIVVNKAFMGKYMMLPAGILADIAPTILAMAGIEKPADMTGNNLLESVSS